MRFLRPWARRRRRYDELAESIREHLDEKVADLMDRGMTRAQAELAARRAFGNAALIEERGREVWQWPRIESLWIDVKYAVRQMRQRLGFATAAIATLALGIGVNTAIFTVFHQVLMQAMPIHNAEQLVVLEEHSVYETGTLNAYAGSQSTTFPYSAYQALQQNTTLRGLAASAVAPVTIVTPSMAEDGWMQMVSGSYFDVMELKPLLGRLLTPADDHVHAAHPVAVLSETYWRTHLGADPSLLNHTLTLNGSLVTIVGIVRHQGIVDTHPVALFVPVTLQTTLAPVFGDPFVDPLNCWLNLIGRLAPDTTRAQAESQLNLLWRNWRRDTLHLRKDNIGDAKGWLETHLTVSRGAKGISELTNDFSQPVVLLQVMALFVLLIACGNIANLLLARAVRRQSELAMRAALGARSSRIFQQVIVEGLLLGIAGSIAGMLLGWLTLRLILDMTPKTDILHIALAAPINWQILGAAIAAGLLTSVLFSVAPAILSTRIDILRILHGQKGAVPSGSGTVHMLLVAGQMALSVALLACAAVFGFNLYHLLTANPGFATQHVLSFTVDAAQQGDLPLAANQKYAAIQAGVQQFPGVRKVVYARNGMMSGDESGGDITVTGHLDSSRNPFTNRNMVSPGFFSAMDIPLLAGREFTAADTQPGSKGVIVDKDFVNVYFNGDTQKALNGALIFGQGNPDLPIVGVIPTIRATQISGDPGAPLVFEAWTEDPHIGTHIGQYPAVFYIRTSGDPGALADSVRALVHHIDYQLPVTRLQTMRDHLDDLTFDSRLVTMLCAAMGALALVLAAIGLYGVLAFSVAQRAAEFGVRIALGATRRTIALLITRQVAWLLFAGGITGAFLGALGVLLLLHHDVGLTIHLRQIPLWALAGPGVLTLLAMGLATLLPALRAASITPVEALRSE